MLTTRCFDFFFPQADGENINKLEKADILELTVRHLKRISRLQDPIQEAHRFQVQLSQYYKLKQIFKEKKKFHGVKILYWRIVDL